MTKLQAVRRMVGGFRIATDMYPTVGLDPSAVVTECVPRQSYVNILSALVGREVKLCDLYIDRDCGISERPSFRVRENVILEITLEESLDGEV